MMNGAIGIGADLVSCSLPAPFGNDGLGCELARLVFRSLCEFFVLWFFVLNRNVLVTRQNEASLLRLVVGRADCTSFGLAARVAAIWASTFA